MKLHYTIAMFIGQIKNVQFGNDKHEEKPKLITL